MARPPISIQPLGKTGSLEKFFVRVQSTSGGNGLPYDEFILSISDTCLGIWQSAGTTFNQIAEQLAGMIVELHGNAGKFSDNYLISSINTDSADTVDDVIENMSEERNLSKYIDTSNS